MGFTKEIFNRANITAISDYLLYGSPEDGEERDYETRMNEAYHKFDKHVSHYAPKDSEKLMDFANELVSEATDVYTEIGIQAGILIMTDLMKNTKFVERMSDNEPQKIDYQEMYQSLFREVSLALKLLQKADEKEVKKADEKEVKKAEMILKAAQCRTEEIYIATE